MKRFDNGFYNCLWCNKKYKREEKMVQHIQTVHPFAKLHANHRQLSPEQCKDLLLQLHCYTKLVQIANGFNESQVETAITQYLGWNGETPIGHMVTFVWASHMLLPVKYAKWLLELPENITRPEELTMEISENVPEKIPHDDLLFKDLRRITFNHLEFCHRVRQSGLLAKAISNADQLELLVQEFTRFLNLGLPWNGGNFCPSLTIDLVWHASMMHNAKYAQLCRDFIGNVIPHCLEENEEKHSERYTEFVKHFRDYHKREPLKIEDLVLGDEDAFVVLAEKKQAAKLAQEKRRKEQRIANEAYIAEERKRNEAYFQKYGRYPQSSFDDGKC